ncbi:MAG: hypothetical protein VB115_14335 [Christensenellaceae bacterium]|nr:hypothetical protein [Christensenellaceae bacterium]
MKAFKDLASLAAHLKKQINASLVEAVAPKVEKTMEHEIGSTVYDSYTPTEYARRGELGAAENIVSEEVGEGAVLVKSVAKSSPSVVDGSVSDQLPQWVSEGVPDIFNSGGGPWSEPRDFVGATVERLKSEGEIKKSMAASLNARGIRTTG